MRDLRRAHLCGRRPYLYRLFRKVFPEYDCLNAPFKSQEFRINWNIEKHWIESIVGYDSDFTCHPPSDYRRMKNRIRRRRYRRVIRKAEIDREFEDVVLPRVRRDVRWDCC